MSDLERSVRPKQHKIITIGCSGKENTTNDHLQLLLKYSQVANSIYTRRRGERHAGVAHWEARNETLFLLSACDQRKIVIH